MSTVSIKDFLNSIMIVETSDASTVMMHLSDDKNCGNLVDQAVKNIAYKKYGFKHAGRYDPFDVNAVSFYVETKSSNKWISSRFKVPLSDNEVAHAAQRLAEGIDTLILFYDCRQGAKSYKNLKSASLVGFAMFSEIKDCLEKPITWSSGWVFSQDLLESV